MNTAKPSMPADKSTSWRENQKVNEWMIVNEFQLLPSTTKRRSFRFTTLESPAPGLRQSGHFTVSRVKGSK